jgi:DNA-binding Lrp family transcriptional regulator
VIERLRRLLESGVLTRFGPLFQIERAGGLFVLAAMAGARGALRAPSRPRSTPTPRWRTTTGATMRSTCGSWSARKPPSAAAAIARIEAETGLPVLAFPKEREYFVELRKLAEWDPLTKRSSPWR